MCWLNYENHYLRLILRSPWKRINLCVAIWNKRYNNLMWANCCRNGLPLVALADNTPQGVAGQGEESAELMEMSWGMVTSKALRNINPWTTKASPDITRNYQVGFFHQEILGVVLLPLYYPLIGLHVKLYNIIGSRHCIGQGGAVKCCSINDWPILTVGSSVEKMTAKFLNALQVVLSPPFVSGTIFLFCNDHVKHFYL